MQYSSFLFVFVLFFFLSSYDAYAERTTCLNYDDIVDKSIQNFDVKTYQGEWFVASTNEPTEPKICKCDIFNWTITSATEFSDADTTTCAGFTSTLGIVGTLSTDSSRAGWLQEGMPPIFPLIDNFVTYAEYNEKESDYISTIRYSCKENYVVGVPPFRYQLFESVQIWTREPVTSADNLDRLFAIALDQGIVQDPSSMINNTFAGCEQR